MSFLKAAIKDLIFSVALNSGNFVLGQRNALSEIWSLTRHYLWNSILRPWIQSTKPNEKSHNHSSRALVGFPTLLLTYYSRCMESRAVGFFGFLFPLCLYNVFFKKFLCFFFPFLFFFTKTDQIVVLLCKVWDMIWWEFVGCWQCCSSSAHSGFK